MDSWRLVVDELAVELGALRAFEAEVDCYPELQLHPAVIAIRTKVALASSAVSRCNLRGTGRVPAPWTAGVRRCGLRV